jgi:hypothetical protein
MCACHCSGRQSHAGSRPALAVDYSEAKSPEDDGDWYQFCFYNNLENALKAGRAMTYGPVGGKPISVAEGHHIIARDGHWGGLHLNRQWASPRTHR